MTDLTTTRLNHLVDPTLHVWAWQIPVYLFLGGLVAGMMAISGVWLMRGRRAQPGSVMFALPLLSLVLLSLGMLALFLDLEHKLYVWRLYTTFEWRSPMSWGAWILVAVYPALVIMLMLHPPAWLGAAVPMLTRWSAQLQMWPTVARRIGMVSVVLGGMLGIYTGVLLSTLAARPAWNSALLGPLFLTSGLSSAAALVHLIARRPDESHELVRVDNWRAIAIDAYVLGAALFLGGPYTAVLWVGVVGIGILVPLTVQTLMVRHRVPHTALAPALVLAGGVLLRFVMVSGQVMRSVLTSEGVT
jgi:formate-dependent nitrite reductase membrane component NrfD